MRSTASQMKDFMSTLQWLDILDELDNWTKDIQEIQDTSEDMAELLRCQGRKEAINHLKNIPEVLLDSLEGKDG